MSKPILCLDFDGVIHSYTSGWKGADVIPDAPVADAMRFIWDATDHFRVAIYSSRSGQRGGIRAMRSWLHEALSRCVVFRQDNMRRQACRDRVAEREAGGDGHH